MMQPDTTVKAYLGIDGGGSKTTFLLADESGKPLASCEMGAGNPNDIGIDTCLAMLRQGCDTIFAAPQVKALALDPSRVSVFAGIAGCTIEAYRLAICQHLTSLGFAKSDCRSDVENALALAKLLAGNPVIAVITGTGIVAFAETDGIRHQTAGYGHLFDNGGSGYNLGRDAIVSAYESLDGRAEGTALVSMIEEKIGGDMRKNIRSLYDGGKRFIASFAPLVFAAYKQGDHAAEAILQRNARSVADIILAAAKPFGTHMPPVVLCGGLCHSAEIMDLFLRPLLPSDCQLRYTCQAMVLGALEKAKQQ